MDGRRPDAGDAPAPVPPGAADDAQKLADVGQERIPLDKAMLYLEIKLMRQVGEQQRELQATSCPLSRPALSSLLSPEDSLSVTKGWAARMLGSLCAIVVVWLSISAAAGELPTAPVFRAPMAPVLDGRLEGDPAWVHAPAIGPFRRLGSVQEPRRTTCRVLWDDDWLYVAYRCDEPSMDQVHATARDGDNMMWQNDGIEVFVLPEKAKRFFQIIVNTIGNRINYARDLEADLLRTVGLEGTRAAAVQGKDHWTAELAISFKAIGVRPLAGARWQGNFGRNVTVGGLKHLSWSPLKRQYAEPERFGTLTFHDRAATPKDAKLVAPAKPADPLLEQLAVHLPFDEGAGKVVRAMTKGTPEGTITAALWAEGRFDKALAFNGRDSYVDLPVTRDFYRSLGDTFTIDVWCCFDLAKLAGKEGTIISTTPCQGGFSYGYYLAYADGRASVGEVTRGLIFGVATDWGRTKSLEISRWAVAQDAIKVSGWHHIIAVFDLAKRTGETQSRIYVDGRPTRLSRDTSIEARSPSRFPTTVGARRFHSDQPDRKDRTAPIGKVFNGIIDEVKLWRAALTGDEIRRLYCGHWTKSLPIEPEHGAAVASGRPLLRWTDPGDGTEVVLEMSDSPAFTAESTERRSLGATQYRCEAPLAPGVWYWRIWSTDKSGNPTMASEVRALIVPSGYGFVPADTMPPVIADVRPPRETRVKSDTPTISGVWRDETALDLSSARLVLDGKDVTARAQVSPGGIAYASAPLAGGIHRFQISIRDSAGNRANEVAQRFSVGAPWKKDVKIDPDRRLRINGEPFFPVMFYAVNQYCYANHGNEYAAIARAGFNCVYDGLSFVPPRSADLGMKQRRIAAGMKYFGNPAPRRWARPGSFDPRRYEREFVPYWNQDPCLIAYTLDEPCGVEGGLEVARQFYEIIRRQDNSLPALWIVYGSSYGQSFGEVADGIALDRYPVGKRPLVDVKKELLNLRRLLGPTKPMWFFVQGFDWLLNSLNHSAAGVTRKAKADLLAQLRAAEHVFRPTPKELRLMTYLAIASGADGVVLYTASGGPRFVSMSDFPEDWAAMEALASELRHLAPILAAPDAPASIRPVHDDRGIDTFTRVYKGDTFLIAVNPQEQWVTQTFELEGGAGQSVEALFENRKVRLAGDRFTDLFDPYAAHVYRIE